MPKGCRQEFYLGFKKTFDGVVAVDTNSKLN
jgi:hypothetical protein